MEGSTGMQLIVVLCLMFFGALGAGYLPYLISIPQTKLQTVSALGGGLLIGSALTVIIPEGFHAFSEASQAHFHLEGHSEGHSGSGQLPDGFAGLALVVGFLVMLVLDQLQMAAGGHEHHHLHTPPGGAKHSHALEKGQEKIDSIGVPVSPCDIESHVADRAIAGLLVHCLADGLAMGAAFLSGNAALSLVVGTAMVLHKAPMAFGLATYLIACRWTWNRARHTLLTFAGAAPAATVVTYTFLRSVPMLTTPTAVALAVLFSGGTFLHSATMHILPEVIGGTGCGQGRMSMEQLVAVIVGCSLPALFSWGHHH